MQTLWQTRILIRGAGDLATGVAARLWRSGLRRILMLETPAPMAVRRAVAFSEAVYEGRATVEGITAERVSSASPTALESVWEWDSVAVLVDPEGSCLSEYAPDVFIEATLSKRNIGLRADMAPLVLALGPGYNAGTDAHQVIETNRGTLLGRVIDRGAAEANTGVPGEIRGFARERVLRCPDGGVVHTDFHIGQPVRRGDAVCRVGDTPVVAEIDGVVRGLLRDGAMVAPMAKLGDIDPRPDVDCTLITEKALAIGGGVLEAILAHLYTRDNRAD
ncbi:MAG: EF2563 family selenium-dependent molybdenum hydroxylase system protein [Desulfovibrionaceae bacterium]|nr:EF2563 family selenium-dependent molybdenum hydroxylase system protein [Desulfovibrionaceae bacterium]